MIGVLTAGESGDSRDYQYHGLKEWPEAVRTWTRLADTDQEGLLCFGDGSRWEVRVSGLPSTRKDFRGRSIRNSVIVQGSTRSKAHTKAARGLAWRFLNDADGLSRDLDLSLTEELVEASFAGRGLEANLAALLDPAPPAHDDLQLVDPPHALVGADAEDAPRRIMSSIASICQGTPGLVIAGDLYGGDNLEEVRKQLDPRLLDPGKALLLAQAGSTRSSSTLEPRATEGGLTGADPKTSGGRARPTLTTLILAATLAALSLVAVVTIVRRLLGRN